jgi:hypothetical protein
MYIIKMTYKKTNEVRYLGSTLSESESSGNVFENTIVTSVAEAMLYGFPSAEEAMFVLEDFNKDCPTKNIDYEVIEVGEPTDAVTVHGMSVGRA